MKTVFKILTCVFICTLFSLSLVACAENQDNRLDSDAYTIITPEKTEAEVDVMRLHFIDVGQGDCIFVDYGEKEALIDCGEWEYSDKVIQYITPYVDEALDLVIATHPDSDHIGGMMYIFDSFQVDCLIDSGAYKDTITYENYMNAVSNEPECEIVLDDDLIWEMGEQAYIRIIETGDSDSDVNEISVVSEVVYGEISVLLTGDMGSKTERKNLGKFSEVTVLKAGHHGSSKSTSEEFLSITKPDYVILSAGKDNSYGHPHTETLKRLSKIGSIAYCTMDNGTIVMETDGKTLSFTSEGSITVTEPYGDSTYSTGSSVNFGNEVNSGDMSNYEASEGAAKGDFGSYYVGNKNSKRFHYSYCNSVKRMSDKNKIAFDSRNEAIGEGYKPCGNCNP